MTFLRSIRFRIVSTILIFGFLMILLNFFTTFVVMKHNFGKLIVSLMETEIDSFLYKYKDDSTAPLPHSKYMAIVKGIQEVPEPFRTLAETLPPGIHNLHDYGSKRPFLLGVIAPTDSPDLYYMIFKFREFMDDKNPFNPRNVLKLSSLISLLPVVLIGFLTSRILMAPIEKLVIKIRTLDPENLAKDFSENLPANEMSLLTSTLESTMTRIHDFIEREKQFTRDASHELRTPLTVAKGAVEVMEQNPVLLATKSLKRPLDRIDRAVKEMETTINTFLWLAREESPTDASCLVEEVVLRAVESNRHLIAEKNIDVHLNIQGHPRINAPEEVFFIAVTNLLKNSFHFTQEGSVTVSADTTRLEIVDTGPGIDGEVAGRVTEPHVKGKKSAGFGLGLSIVQRLSLRFGWVLDVESRDNQGTLVRLTYGPQQGITQVMK